MSQELKQRNRKRWILFFVALIVPILLVLGLFFAAQSDIKTKQQYDQLRNEYTQERELREKEQQQLSGDEQYQQLQKDQEAQLSNTKKP